MEIYELNQGQWGVCGFAATLQAVESNKRRAAIAARRTGQPVQDAYQFPYPDSHSAFMGLLASLKDNGWLGQHERELLKFTEVFGYAAAKAAPANQVAIDQFAQLPEAVLRANNPYYYPDIATVVAAMGQDVHMEGRAGNRSIGIASTANVLMELCKNQGFKSANFIGGSSALQGRSFDYSNCIYGLRLANHSPFSFRFGLQHWLYVDAEGQPMTYGAYGAAAWAMLERMQFVAITHRINLGALSH